MSTRNEFIAGLMLEAAELLKESAGANGVVSKYYGRRLDKAKNDIQRNYLNDMKDSYDTKKEQLSNKEVARQNRDFAAGLWGPEQMKGKERRLETGKRDSIHNRINKRAALKEAVDLLYEKAVMCEDASEAEGYIEKAEELQKAIEDIPEETPVKTDDYDPDVNGGEGPELDHEEIKDLCGGDKEVMDLLLDDEDKSVTVDADGSNNESILSW